MSQSAQAALREAAYAAVNDAACRHAAMHGRKRHDDSDFDVAWDMWEALRGIIPERPLWLRHTPSHPAA